MASRGVPCRLALLQLSGQSGRPTGTAYAYVTSSRDAMRILGSHTPPTPTAGTSFSSSSSGGGGGGGSAIMGSGGVRSHLSQPPTVHIVTRSLGALRSERSEYLCVHNNEEAEPLASFRSGRRGSGAGGGESTRLATTSSTSSSSAHEGGPPPKPLLSLVETMHEGARVTGPMAAAALEDLVSFLGSSQHGGAGRFQDEA